LSSNPCKLYNLNDKPTFRPTFALGCSELIAKTEKHWTKQLGTSTDELGYGVTGDTSNNIYVTGYTKGGLNGNANSRNFDIFLVRYNSEGVLQ
jgi:hypothetical protein